ncbi:guanitoxin biosynthesis pre-guanitoxin forming N-methyltransferase GntF [Pseudobacteriovorax antillogorgiicola]|uniref:NNMT/PNMT/TEMT family protein n=1 Tax=Pseudobacteriovorax antillogorgiicola TaxID=1513793 RepID=A0A1Y6CGQ0_9BACT|nr:guanitoxin biosynthesis pre-guanitoxin forming N-methyltransferase GntF [Pseudobacteriovorax antillogorgiicola]TCS46940.1 NNMT/PNMT/TEMT family protein [Pseudobacteriovorax antillogorgiicola]SMF64390.1 NNMT/PNMT/TEMT family protein [Pseudobacteriovorax antillogorgiicola]
MSHDLQDDTSSFEGRAYLNEYFTEVNDEYRGLYRFWIDSIKKMAGAKEALELGVGPTLYTALPLTAVCESIDLADYVLDCFKETNAWLNGDTQSFNWNIYTKLVLELEGSANSAIDIKNRENLVRLKIRDTFHCNIKEKNPIAPRSKTYDIVTAHYCTEAASDSVSTWEGVIRNIWTLVRPGGWLLLSVSAGLKRFRQYADQEPCTSSPQIDKRSVLKCIETLPGAGKADWEYLPAPHDRPYEGTVLLAVQRSSL